MDLNFITGLMSSTLIMTTPILFAAIGEIFSQRSGILNLGIEGSMATGAFFGLLAAIFTGSLWVGLAIAMVSCLLLNTFFATLSIKIGVNQVIGGLLLWMLGEGISYYGNRTFYSSMQAGIKPFEAILFGQNIMIYLAVALAIISGLILFKTTLGLKIRAIGENPRAADSAGIGVNRLRFASVLFGGAMTGLAGAALTLGIIGHFGEGMVAGRGWIAIIVVILSKWNPYTAIGSSILFGFAYALGARLIVTGAPVPYHFLLMLPYFFALIAIFFLFRRAKPPAALMVPYKRE